MKVALITDSHYGSRSDSLALLDYMKRFFDTVFFPYLDAHNIQTICHLGDLVDRRKYINIHTANRMRVDFIEPIVKSGRTMHITVGNHDVFYKNSNQVNVLAELLAGIDQIKIHMHPTEIVLGETPVLFMPWLCEDNEVECLEAIRASTAKVLFGHLELKGFQMNLGSFCETGLDPARFAKFKLVCSGHFHHKSTFQNINYLGNPFETTWNDFGDPKGFHIFDTETLSLKFISNPFKLFRKLHYTDEKKTFEEVLDVDFSAYANTYVKVIVSTKTNPYLYDCFIQKLEEAGPLDVKSVDDHLNVAMEADADIISKGEGTLDILTKTVRGAGFSEEYQKPLEDLLRTLYGEASLLGA